jgi:hypothetical protein
MRGSNFIGLILGLLFTAFGLWWTPFIFRCHLSDFFPILRPPEADLENPACFHCDACAVDLVGTLWLLSYFSAVFMVSGAVASRIGAQQSPMRGAVAVGLTVAGALLHLATAAAGADVDTSATAIVGVSALLISIVCAYGAAYLVTRNA